MHTPEEFEKLKRLAVESPRMSINDAAKLSPALFDQWQLSARRRTLTIIAWIVAVFVASVSRGSNWDQICMGLSAGLLYYLIARWVTNLTMPSRSSPLKATKCDWAFYALIALAIAIVLAYAQGWLFLNFFADHDEAYEPSRR